MNNYDPVDEAKKQIDLALYWLVGIIGMLFVIGAEALAIVLK